ncbi:DUF2971 domain-containing protein [Pseudomonas mosselii]|uniref:DUF2971 domain-containing protein n=1 Tax=unclassified Pseudomonas TaxID=196821 RepID=UPI0020C205C4|nr:MULTISPECIES: DUF2971 domain-containing protein [unclassified Pseudomonas]MCP8634024.1 DUF2971 domain-containing protein [Pseudomonas sp. DVZ6]MDD7783851.1 DUF2971 domain-containing protein [Pseudomonas sp. DVZ24]
MNDKGKYSADKDDVMFSREAVIECPHMMVLLGYLSQSHDTPKYGWKKNGLRYHYTDAAGLLGIIQNGRLWATDLRFLNDPSEGTYLPERLLELMALKPGGINDIEQKIIEGVKNALLSPRSNYPAFCVSLSADGDLLSQWRGYGDFGKGYAIGLNLGFDSVHPQVANFYDVVYGDDQFMDLAVDLLDLFASATPKWSDMMYGEWAATLSVIAKSFKHQGYSEEQESRLICSRSGDGVDLFTNELPLKFRAKGSDLIPYIPMSLGLLADGDEPRLPIQRIVVGPGVNFERNYSSIADLLKANSYENVIVERSAIPFRP